MEAVRRSNCIRCAKHKYKCVYDTNMNTTANTNTNVLDTNTDTNSGTNTQKQTIFFSQLGVIGGGQEIKLYRVSLKKVCLVEICT